MWPQSEDTVQLLNDLRNGRSDAAGELLDRHRDSLCRLVKFRLDRALARRLDASDVVQDVLLEASNRLNDYVQDPSMPFHLWLRSLARDRIIDMHRRHRTAQRRSVDREQSLTRPGNSDGSYLDLAAQLQDAELTPAGNVAASAALSHRPALDVFRRQTARHVVHRNSPRQELTRTAL